MKPIIVINLKTYKSGKDALKLAKTIEKYNKAIIVGVQSTDIFNISNNTKLEVFAQHVDLIEPGRHTGFISTKSVKGSGAKGVFINHSEHPLTLEKTKKTVEICKKEKLKTLVFTGNLSQAKKIEKFKPDFIVYEPKELVSSSTITVSDAKPEVIAKIAKALKSKILVGAGVKKTQDITVSMKLGARGVALSSAITTSKTPFKKLKEIFG